MAQAFALGQTVRKGSVPEVFWWDAFFQRYGWTYPDVRTAPEPLLEELSELMKGEAEGARIARARSGSPGHTGVDAGDGESAAQYAARQGLPPPPGGWPRPPVADASSPG